MTNIKPFEEFSDRYEQWFIDNKFAYLSELEALRDLLPKQGKSLEIGVGSGQFSIPLNIDIGIDPSHRMLDIARSKGQKVKFGTGENIPFGDNEFDLVMLVTSICFVDDLDKTLNEAKRVLKPNGQILIGYVDKESPLGKFYQKHKDENVFYKYATFYTTDQVIELLNKTGFHKFKFRQTIFSPLMDIRSIEPIKIGYGTGSFVAVNAQLKK